MMVELNYLHETAIEIGKRDRQIASQAAEIERLTAELEVENGAAANYRADAIAAGKKCGELLAALEDIAWSRPIGQKPNKYVELLERKALDAITSAKGQP